MDIKLTEEQAQAKGEGDENQRLLMTGRLKSFKVWYKTLSKQQ